MKKFYSLSLAAIFVLSLCLANTATAATSPVTVSTNNYLINALNLINTTLSQILSAYNSIVQGGTQTQPVVTPIPTPTPNPIPAPTPTNLGTTTLATAKDARYVRIDITKTGWVSLREVEVYDDLGNKITGISTTASGEYTGWYLYNCSGQAMVSGTCKASNVLDGNQDTVWHAGDNLSTCNFYGNIITAAYCPWLTRTAWIQLDLGSVKKVSKIKVMPTGDIMNGSIGVSFSANGSGYYHLPTYNEPFRDHEFVQWPGSSYAGDPTVSLTFNGLHDATIKYGAPISTPYTFSWQAGNADYLKIDGTVTGESSTLSTNDQQICAQLSGSVVGDTFTPTQRILPLSGTKESTFAYGACPGTYTFTMTAIQRYTGKTATDVVVVKMVR